MNAQKCFSWFRHSYLIIPSPNSSSRTCKTNSLSSVIYLSRATISLIHKDFVCYSIARRTSLRFALLLINFPPNNSYEIYYLSYSYENYLYFIILSCICQCDIYIICNKYAFTYIILSNKS